MKASKDIPWGLSIIGAVSFTMAAFMYSAWFLVGAVVSAFIMLNFAKQEAE
jgi:hypothetical protein